MARFTFSVFFFLCSIQCLSVAVVHCRLVPALYVFGDSLSDVGNNIFLPGAKAKPNYKPYAIDFPNGTFGRFTNGYTLAEHLAFFLGLPMQLPILDPRSQTTNCTDGFNYASSSAGILPDTGVKIAGSNLCLGKQVQLFKKTAQEFLVSRLREEKAIKRHLGKSIYFILIGSNDFIENYIISDETRHMYTPHQFAELLVLEFARSVQELYGLGARRFVVSEIGPLGCTPAAIKTVPNLPTRCVENLNGLVSFFNVKLAEKTGELNRTLKSASFVTMKADFLAQIIDDPQRYGLKDATNPCCTVDNEVSCAPNVPPCEERQSHVFFDAAHTTNAANKLIAKACFKGVGACAPVNIRRFLKLHKYVEHIERPEKSESLPSAMKGRPRQ